MKTNTEIYTEYVPCRKTKIGTWRPITTARYRSKLEAERRIERELSLPGAAPSEDYKVMQRTVVVTLSAWANLPVEDEKEAEK